MQKLDRSFSRLIIKNLVILILCVAAIKLTKGFFMFAMIFAGIAFAANKKIDKFFKMYTMIPFISMLNGTLSGASAMFSIGCKVSIFASTGMMLMQGFTCKTRERLPIGGMFLYIACVSVSSLEGYCPPVSFMKLALYFVFMIGLFVGGKLLADNPSTWKDLRATFLAFCIFLVFGSLLTMLIPSIGYMDGSSLASMGYTEKQINEFLASNGGLNLFRGVTNHSQTLATLVISSLGFAASDMLFVEKRVTKLHVALILGVLPLMYMSRSRCALLGFMVLCFMLFMICMPKIRMHPALKRRVRSAMYTFLAVGAIAALIMEFRDGTMSKWIRKSNDTASDNRSWSEAVTASRQGAVEQNLYDFRRNPLLGSGFQVSENVAIAYQKSGGFMLTAPVEKGVLPLIVLGEGGVLGAISFSFFLIIYFGTCARKKYHIASSMLVVYLSLNMAEGSFFSATGGGYEWMSLVLGGFLIDLMVKHQNGGVGLSTPWGRYYGGR